MKPRPHIIPAAVLAVTLAAAIGAAHADSAPRPGPAAFCADQEARLAAHLAYTESKLALTPAQTEEFRHLSDTLKAAQAPLQALCPTGNQPPALPARLDRQQKMIEAQSEAVRRSAPALLKFYQTLTPAQQALADDLLVIPGGHPGPHFGIHRPGPDGQPGPGPGPDRRGEAPQPPNCAGR